MLKRGKLFVIFYYLFVVLRGLYDLALLHIHLGASSECCSSEFSGLNSLIESLFMRIYYFWYFATNVLLPMVLLGDNLFQTIRAVLLGNVGHSLLEFKAFLFKLQWIKWWELRNGGFFLFGLLFFGFLFFWVFLFGLFLVLLSFRFLFSDDLIVFVFFFHRIFL